MNIKDGDILVLFAFDIANEIGLSKIEKILNKKPVEEQLQLVRPAPKYIKFQVPPVSIQLREQELFLKSGSVKAKVSAKIYDYGVVSIFFKIPIASNLKGLKQQSDEILDAMQKLQDAAREIVKKIEADIMPAVKTPAKDAFVEDYVIFRVKRFEDQVTSSQLVGRHFADIASVLTGDAEIALSQEQKKEIVKDYVTYFNTDLVVVDWNSAFVYDELQCDDTVDILEYANIQLLEMRVYDYLIDKQLAEAYDVLTERKTFWIFNNYFALSKRLSTFRIETSEVFEKVDNSLKIIGELYLAKVYNTTNRRLHLEEWKKSVNRKLDAVKSILEDLQSRQEAIRSELLEIIIILLIAFEIIQGLLTG